MKIRIISIGKLSKDIEKLFADYQKMINWDIRDFEISYSKKLSLNQIKQYEAKLIEEKLDKGACIIALDLSGKQKTSEDFSLVFSRNMMEGRNINFVIGGAFGLDASILSLANEKLCLSKMTLPHQLAKLFLIEQIYRAQTILGGHPYHK